MACLIKNGKFYTTDGKESVLYKELENKVGEVEARELFLLSHTPTFKEFVKPEKEVIQVGKSKIYFKERVLPNKKKTGEIELELIETPLSERGKGTARKALENFLKYTDSLGKNVYLFASPRDRQTSESKLIKFYESLGFRSLDSFLPQEMTRKAKKVSKGEDIPQPTSENFYPNGEVKAEEVINYAEENFKPLQPLSEKEKVDLVNLDIQGVETSDELYHELYNAFYDKDGVFKPNPKKMRKIYSEAEINNILENVEVQAKVKETIERLRNTEEFDIVKIEVDGNFTFKTLETNSIGQYKTNNPLQEKELFEKENGLNGYVKIPTINEDGEVIQEKLIYDNAVKFIDNEKIKTAVDTIVNAHPQAPTEKLEAKVQKWLLDYGLDITSLLREDYSTLNNFINNPSEENTIALEQALGFERKDKQTAVKIENTNRSYRYLKTTKSEEQLFDELSLIQTNEPNVYHQVNKIDEQEMRDILDSQDLTVPEYQLYKKYYEYESQITASDIQTNTETAINYLMDEFVADFAIEKLKNLNDEFLNQFKITESGIEMVSQDETSLVKVKAGISNYPQLADYSLISKNLPNLKEANPYQIQTKESKRVQAVNNKHNIPTPKTEVKIIDNDFVEAKNETADFIRIGEDIYEQQEQGIYSKLQFEENPNYYVMKVEAPKYKLIEQNEIKTEDKTVKSMISKEQNDENFGCL